MLQRCSKFQSECPDLWIRLPRHTWPKSWSSMEDSVVPPERNLYGHPLVDFLWERQFEDVALGLGWEKYRMGNVCLFKENKTFLIGLRGWSKISGKKQNTVLMWKKLVNNVDLDEPTPFLVHVYPRCTQRECKVNESIIDQYREMFESRISATATEKLPGWENTPKLLRGPTTWLDMLKSALKDFVIWRINRRSSCTKSLVLAWMTIVSCKYHT